MVVAPPLHYERLGGGRMKEGRKEGRREDQVGARSLLLDPWSHSVRPFVHRHTELAISQKVKSFVLRGRRKFVFTTDDVLHAWSTLLEIRLHDNSECPHDVIFCPPNLRRDSNGRACVYYSKV